MLSDRLAISFFLIPLALWLIALGGLPYLAGVLLVFFLAAGEYSQLFQHGQRRAARPLLLLGIPFLITTRQIPALNPAGLALTLAVLAPLVWHLVDYERGSAPEAGTDFAVTLGGLFYLGWLGGLFIALRALPDGLWWLVATLTTTWLADSGAYLIGRRFGRHKMAPRLSPKKTWEGYLGGVLGGILGGALLSAAWHLGAGPDSLLTWQTGAMLGILIGVISPLGDLGISMLKRQVGVKDSGQLLSAHGGALDRIDSWLVAVAVGHYFVLFLQAA